MLAQYLSYEFIALFMFITMLVMMFTGQRVFGAIGFVAAASALLIWGEGSMEMPYTCLLYTSPSPRDATLSRMPSSA